MKPTDIEAKLEREREKLEKLAREALQKGISPIEDERVLIQTRKVDRLIVKIQREQERFRKNQGER